MHTKSSQTDLQCIHKHCSNFNFNSNKFDDCFDHFQNISITMKIYAASLQICEILSKWAHSTAFAIASHACDTCFYSAAARSRPNTHTHAHINRRPNTTDPLESIQTIGLQKNKTHRCSPFTCTYLNDAMQPCSPIESGWKFSQWTIQRR